MARYAMKMKTKEGTKSETPETAKQPMLRVGTKGQGYQPPALVVREPAAIGNW